MNVKVQIAEPSPLFQPFVKHYKYIESSVSGTYKVVPITDVELYFNLTHIHVFCEGYFDIDNPRIHLAGLQHFDQNSYSHMTGTGRGGGFAVVFKPQGFYNLFNVLGSDFSKYALEGIDIFDKKIYDMHDRLEGLFNVIDMKNLFEGFFEKTAIKAIYGPGLLNSIVSYMESYNGKIRVSQICELFNITSRSLQRQFRNEIGMSPREFLQIVRINRAIKLMTSNPDTDLTEISYLSGYYDQAHFTKDIKKIVGITPGEAHRVNDIKNTTHHNRWFV